LGIGHIGGALSIVDVLTVLYHKQLRINPQDPKWDGRDRFVLSKGHAGPALYATLASRGYFPAERLSTLNQLGTDLPSHCDMLRTPGIDMTAGSLGQGLSAALGIALGLKTDGKPNRVFAIIGDGESQEGSIWEAAMFAPHFKLSNLTVFVDFNRMQIDGTVAEIMGMEPVVDKWTSFGWHVQRIDGHDVGAIDAAIEAAKLVTDKPSVIILNTVKGKGAFFAEGLVGSHNMPITEEQWRKAVGELA
jgi:transketolase